MFFERLDKYFSITHSYFDASEDFMKNIYGVVCEILFSHIPMPVRLTDSYVSSLLAKNVQNCYLCETSTTKGATF